MTEDVKRVAAAIAGNPTAWRWANGLILVAAIVPALGLVPINLRFEGPARAWASTGLVAFVFAALFAAIYRMISIQVTTWAAPQYPDPTAFAVWEAFEGLGAGIPAFVFLGTAALGVTTWQLSVPPRSTDGATNAR